MVSLNSRVIQQGYCEYWPPNNSSCGDCTAAIVWWPHGTAVRRPHGRQLQAQIFNDCATTKYLSHATAFTVNTSTHQVGRAINANYIPESCAEYRLRLMGNYRDKDMPRYDLNITIFDTIQYIVPSLFTSAFISPHLLPATSSAF